MLELKNIHFKYQQKTILHDITISIQQGESVAVIGSSGSGKSTLLKVMAGLEPIQSGIIIKPDNVKLGYVFQTFELFPHLTVLDNLILAPMKVLKKSRAECTELAIKTLEQVKMASFVDRFPNELSGGQQQRAAIARALMMRPNIMLFDEPTSALDPEMVNEVLEVIYDLKNSGMTVVIASHEMKFIQRSTDRVIFLDHGKMIEDQPTALFFSHPKTERAKVFLAKILQ